MNAAIPGDIASLADYERHFLARSERGVAAYVSGAAADGLTHAWNRAAFDGIALRPRVLADFSDAHTRLALFGLTLEAPILLAPVAYHRLVHPDGEVGTAVGAGLAQTVLTVGSQASCRIEDIAAAASWPLWFQLYLRPRFAETLALLRRAESAGCRALVVTVDAPVVGLRNMEQRAGFSLPEGVRAVHLDGMDEIVATAPPGRSPVFSGLMRAAPTWREVERLRAATGLPLLLKGILDPRDARLAIEVGADGLIVSNHGGRALDGAPASLAALPAIAETVAGAVPLLLDGGIRRGTDIVKALALGASAVMVGRPQLHALAVGGAAGVAHLLAILKTELEVAMALAGCPRLETITGDVVGRDRAAERFSADFRGAR